MLKTNQQVMEELIEHLRLGKPISNRRRKPIGDRTVKKYRIWIPKIENLY